MNRIAILYAGEMNRMRRYGVSGASLVVAVLWIAMLHFSGVASIITIFPLMLFVDSTMMSLLLFGVTLVFENQEESFKSMMVCPITKDEYLMAKSLAVMTSSVITLVLLLSYGMLAKNLQVNVPGIATAVVIVAFAFAQLGAIMTYHSRDFTDLLLSMIKFALVFSLPTLLEAVNILKGDWVKTLQYLNPTKNALTLLRAAAVPVDRKDLLIAAIYLLGLGAGLYAISRKLFDQYVAKGGA